MDSATIYSPFRIGILLHCHTNPAAFDLDHDAVFETLKEFEEMGVIKEASHGYYNTTPLGKAWVNALCNVKVPKYAFIDEQGRVLDAS